MGVRTFEVMNFYSSREAVLRAQRAFPDVQFRYIIGPNQNWSLDNLDYISKYFNLVPISYSSHQIKKQW
jgi:hypothetical protein